MSVQTNGAQGQAPGTGTPQAGQAPDAQQGQQGTDATGAQGQAPDADGQQFDLSTIQDPALKAYLERQDAELRRARDDAAKYRTEKAAEAQRAQELQRQNETDQQRIAREQQERDERLKALEDENRKLKVGGAVSSVATAAGAFDASLVADLIHGELTFDDQGKPTNVKAAVDKLKADRPYLFKLEAAGADAGAGTGRQAAPTQGVGSAVNAALRGSRSGVRVTR